MGVRSDNSDGNGQHSRPDANADATTPATPLNPAQNNARSNSAEHADSPSWLTRLGTLLSKAPIVSAMLVAALGLLGLHTVLAILEGDWVIALLAATAWGLTLAVLAVRITKYRERPAYKHHETIHLQSAPAEVPNQPPQLSADGIAVEMRFDRPLPQEIAQELVGDLAGHLQNWRPPRSNDPRIDEGMMDLRLQAKLQVLDRPRR